MVARTGRPRDFGLESEISVIEDLKEEATGGRESKKGVGGGADELVESSNDDWRRVV